MNDFSTLIGALRMAGAEQFDPMRLHYLEVLARRAMAHQGRVKRLLDARLAQALAGFKERFEQAQCDAKETIAQAAPHSPETADALERLLGAGDFEGVGRLVATLKKSTPPPSLGALVDQLEQHSPENAGARFELKTIQRFRNTWSKLSADKQVTQALEQTPPNAGPLNSHMLVLRSLALMRDISPDYLNRFMSYADTLVALDQCEKEKPGGAKKPPQPKTARK